MGYFLLEKSMKKCWITCRKSAFIIYTFKIPEVFGKKRIISHLCLYKSHQAVGVARVTAVNQFDTCQVGYQG